MSRYSVCYQARWWEIVVSQRTEAVLTPVWFVRYEDGVERRKLLCQVAGNKHDGWDVVVEGDIVGIRLVKGFKTRWKAIEYAIDIRPDLNVEAKRVMAL